MTTTKVAIPGSLGELLSPEWLNPALGTRFPGINVTGVTPGPIVERVSTNARFRIECDPEVPAGLSPALCAKGYFAAAAREGRRQGEREALFYRDIAEATGVHTLPSVWADVDTETHCGVVITEDVVEAGATFRDTLTPCTADQTAALLSELARLHAYGWESTRAQAPWLAPRIGHVLEVRGVQDINRNFDSELGARVPDPVRDAQRLVDAVTQLAARQPGAGWTIVHGDMHVGNTFLDAAGRPAILDWQLVQHGHWSLDVAYHIASALDPAARAANERDLLRHYLDALAAEGATPPALDPAWVQYRRAMPYGFFMWGITIYVRPDIIEVLLHRLGTATDELESYAALSDEA